MATTCFNPRTRVGCDRIPSTLAPLAVRFQSTHPRGVRRTAAARSRAGELVSIHAPAWGATRRGSHQISASGGFNPRTRVGCDPSRNCMSSLTCRFQSTHPRGVRLRERFSIDSMDEFQSTHPRGVRLANVLWQQVMVPVSIHAPAWGATRQIRRGFPEPQVSIHAPAWGATHAGHIMLVRDPVSIHAPAWGATTVASQQSQSVIQFQSTHPRGVRHLARDGGHHGHTRFNPRTRVGCDGPGATCGGSRWSCFNPRTRVGCDAPSGRASA